jgi:hypothetical protein
MNGNVGGPEFGLGTDDFGAEARRPRGLVRTGVLFASTFAAAVLALVIRIPALRAGFALDDFAHMAVARGLFPLHRAPWNLFAFVRSEADVRLGIATGALPWWTDHDLRLAFFRPISSLLATFDARVLGPDAALQHAHSLAWLLALFGLTAVLFRRLLAPRAALLATFVFAFEEGVTTPLAWIANRSAIVSTTFLVLALVAWTNRRRSRRAAITCEVATVLALLGGEYGIGVLFLRGALTLAERDVPLRRRATAVLGLTAALGAYVVLHRALGYRVAAFPLYRDPTADLGAFAAWAAEQMRRLLQDLVLGVPTAIPPSAVTTLWSFAVLALLAAVAWPKRTDAPRRFGAHALALGSLASLAPLASSIAHTRLLMVPALGMSALVGAALDASLTTLTARLRPFRPARRALAAFIVLVVGWNQLPQAAFRSWMEGLGAEGPNRRRIEAILRVPLAASDRVVLLSAGDPTTILYFPEVRAIFDAVVPSDFRVLAASASAVRVRRVDDRTLELDMPNSGWLASPLASIMREPRKVIPEGSDVVAGPMVATVLDNGAFGPTRVRFRFDRSLDDPSMKFFITRSTGFEAFAMPRVGDQAGVPPAADPCEAPR